MPSRDQLGVSGQTPLTADLTRTGRDHGHAALHGARAVPRRAVDASAPISSRSASRSTRRSTASGRSRATTYAELCANVCTGAVLPPAKGPKASTVPGLAAQGIAARARARSSGALLVDEGAARGDRARPAPRAYGAARAAVRPRWSPAGPRSPSRMHPSQRSACAAGGEHVHQRLESRAQGGAPRRVRAVAARARASRLRSQRRDDRPAGRRTGRTATSVRARRRACAASSPSTSSTCACSASAATRCDERDDRRAAMAGDAEIVDHALDAFSALPPVAACADTTALLAAVAAARAGDHRGQVTAVRDQLDRVRAETRARQLQERAAEGDAGARRRARDGYRPGDRRGRARSRQAPAEPRRRRRRRYAARGDAHGRAGRRLATMLDASAWLMLHADDPPQPVRPRAGDRRVRRGRRRANRCPPLDIYVRLQDMIALLDADPEPHRRRAEAIREDARARRRRSSAPITPAR